MAGQAKHRATLSEAVKCSAAAADRPGGSLHRSSGLLPGEGSAIPLAPATAKEDDGVVPTVILDPLSRLAEDVRAAAWLLPEGDPLRGHLEMLGALPPTVDAWEEVLEPWLDAARHGLWPRLDGRGELAAAGALGVAALRAARELPEGSSLLSALRAAARWCFFLVRPDAR
jgi:hypothetical protein